MVKNPPANAGDKRDAASTKKVLLTLLSISVALFDILELK